MGDAMSARPQPRFGEGSLLRLLAGGGGRLKLLYAAAMFAWAAIYAMPLVVGAIIALLLDRAAAPQVPHEVWWLLAATVGLMALRALLLLIGLQLTFKLIFQMSAWIKVQVLRGVLGRPSGRGPALGNGEILNRLRDDSDEIGGLLEWTTDLVYRSVLTVIAVAVLAVTDVIMTIPLVLLLGGLFASVVLKRRVAEAQAQTRLRQGRIGGTIADTLTGIRDLRLSATIERRLRSLEEGFVDRRRYQVRQQLYSDLLSDLFRNLVTIGTAVVLLTMSYRVAGGHFTIGKLALFLTYASWLGQQMYFFGKIIARYQGGTVSYARLVELLRGEPPPGAAATAAPGTLRALRVDELTCAAPDGGVAPAPVSFEVKPGELVAITGELGSGKSMIVRSLLALQPDIEGRVRWNDADVTADEGFLRSPRIGYAPQSPRFVRGSVRDNLVLGTNDVSAERIAGAMAAVDLRPGSIELPRGLDTRLASGDASQLSGGQRQRLALARMLCRPAAVYVVDDCDSSIDAATARAIWATLPTRWPGAWIVVSHNPDLLAAADTVVTLGRRTPEPTSPVQ
jgi:ATP-binding cassette subfamily B protein